MRGGGAVRAAGRVPAGGIEVAHVRKAYGTVAVFDDLSLTVPRGRATVVMGPSGCGKTTLLRLLMGLEAPDAGSIAGLEGVPCAAVFQEDRLCENLSASANVCLPHGGLDRAARRALRRRVAELLDRVGLGACAGRPVRELSGGQRRRVAVVRAVLADADVLLCDEPLKGLDGATKRCLMDAVAPLVRGKTVVWVTHDRADLDCFEGPNLVELPGRPAAG